MRQREGTILFLTTDFPPLSGGMARHACDVALALEKAGESLTVVTVGAGAVAAAGRACPAKVVRIRRLSFSGLFRNYLKSVLFFFGYALFLLPGRRVKLIIANTWSVAGVAAFLVNRICGVPYVVVANGLDVNLARGNRCLQTLMRLVFRNAALVVTISRYTDQLVRKAAGKVRTAVVNPVVDPARFPGRGVGLPERFRGKRIMLTVARLVESKGHSSVIRVLPEVAARFPELVYVIVGQGPEEEKLLALVRELELSDRVFFAGDVPESDLPAYYQACEFFILTSREMASGGGIEGFGIVFLEAAVYGKPVVAGRSGGIPDAVLDQETGLLVDPESPAAISAAVTRILYDRQFARQLGENGRKRVLSELNPDRLGQRLQAHIRRIVNNV